MKKAIAKVKAAAGKASDKVRKASADRNKRRVARNVAKGNVEKAARIAGKPGKRADRISKRGENKVDRLNKKIDKLTTKVETTKAKTASKVEKVNPAPKPKEQTFGQAFKQARKSMGPGKTFTYKGKKYSTNTADDLKKKKPAMGKQGINKMGGANAPFKKLKFGRRK
tara:strand:+ start:162 stop:665 length:504 start_codon:yes stop_codon:yes gene_type:complete